MAAAGFAAIMMVLGLWYRVGVLEERIRKLEALRDGEGT